MKNIFSVGQVNAYIKNVFVQDYVLNDIWVKGEISNYKKHSSGHIYFTLKDQTSAISCVLFNRYTDLLPCELEEGMNIVARGYVSVYERTGQYQVYVQQVQLDGIGALYQKFEELKRRLEKEGLFRQDIKKAIPKFPKKIGIITSPTGAAIEDIKNVIKRRNTCIEVVLYPSLVQGQGASLDIVKGIQTLDKIQDIDIIIVGRGGGSIEDLWAFNEEKVAYAIYHAKTPIISAVGHETDFTIADFVSDLRAPTPSAAAELAVPSMDMIDEMMNQYQYKLNTIITRKFEHFYNIIKQQQLRMNYTNPLYHIQQNQQYLMELENKMDYLIESKLIQYNHKIELFHERLKALSPYRSLKKGMAHITDANGEIVSSINHIETNQTLKVQLVDGELKVNVNEIKEKRWE